MSNRNAVDWGRAPISAANAADIVRELTLQPHPEGGWYREIYRSPTIVQTARGPRSAVTTIYYLLEASQLSRWHVVQSDELWHFYGGAPLELLAYTPDTRVFERRVLGSVTTSDPDLSVAAVSVIPTGVWQAARSLGDYSLVGCTVGPGFEFADFEFVSALETHKLHFVGPMAAYAGLL